MSDKRDPLLIHRASPCDTNYFDSSLLTLDQSRERGREFCPNYGSCSETPRACALRQGVDVARYVLKGGDLRSELLDLERDVPELATNEYWDSQDHKTFSLIRGKARVMRAIERFARVILLEDSNQSAFSSCEKCEGVKLAKAVTDSERDGLGSLTGGGKVRRRVIDYCPTCDPVPRNGTFGVFDTAGF